MNEWRLIIDNDHDGALNLAIDEAILNNCRAGYSSPTVRLYGWSNTIVSIGYLQRNLSFQSSGLPVIRRITGGKAVLHDLELTYSVVCDRSHPLFDKGIRGSYRVINSAILRALRDLSVEAIIRSESKTLRPAPGVKERTSCFAMVSKYEITYKNKKLVGSAQRRFKDVFLQHGSILVDLDKKLFDKVFGPYSSDHVAWLNSGGRKVSRADLKTACVARLEEELEINLKKGYLSKREIVLSDALLKEKYLSEGWNRGRYAQDCA